MTDSTWLTIDWRSADADIPEEQQEVLTEVLFREMNGFDEVERVERVADPNVPDGGMGAAWLWSVLTAEVSGDVVTLRARTCSGRINPRSVCGLKHTG